MMVAALAGCAALERQEAAYTEKLLSEAGFHRLPAESGRRQQDLADLPPREVVVRREGVKTVYAYADPQGCRCLYIGGPKAYAKYREFAVSEAIARDMSLAAPNSAATNFPVWAAWDPRWAPTEAWDDPNPALTDF
jgi:hypothetical protein